MRWSRQPSCRGDAECVSAIFLAFAAVVTLMVPTWLPGGVPRCPVKLWTGLPCLACGGMRALRALLAGDVAAALRLQPLLTLLAFGAAVWIGYGVLTPLLRGRRLRVCLARREKLLLAAMAAVFAAANWAYLVADGR